MIVTSINFRQNIPRDEVSIPLDGVIYNFTFIYNQFDDSWFLSIDDTVQGIKIVNGIDLLEQYRYLNVPPGQLKAIRRTGSKSKPSFNEIGTRKEIDLVYISNV